MGARRRRRSVRMSLSALLLPGSALVVAASLGSGRMVGLAAVVAVLAGIAATRLVVAELGRARRDAARELAQQAVSYQQLGALAAAEHFCFATAMRARLDSREQHVARLRRALRVAMRRADAADRLATAAAIRTAALEQELAELRSVPDAQVVDDEQAIWDGSRTPTVVDLVGRDESAAAAASAAQADWRRRA